MEGEQAEAGVAWPFHRSLCPRPFRLQVRPPACRHRRRRCRHCLLSSTLWRVPWVPGALLWTGETPFTVLD